MYTITNVAKLDNLLLAYNRLLTNPENTYKSYFRDSYTAYGMAYEANLRLLRDKMKSGYLPAPTIRVFMPKANGLNRMYTLLSLEDQIVYQAYANIIAEALVSIREVKQRYRRKVFGNLYSSADSVFFYQPWQSSYKAYTRSIIRAFNRGNQYIASFDLTACYDSINHHLLWSILKNKCHFSDNCADTLIGLLEKWESSAGLELATGIPQGPQASGIVAEAVLAEYDTYIEKLQKKVSFQYFRYVDDIRILAADEDTVRWILFLLDKKSKELGLFPQAAKISVHKITDIESEIKRISKPLFDEEDYDDNKKSSVAINMVRRLLKEDPVDLTTIKRYFRHVKQDSKTNKVAIAAVKEYPNLIHSFAYYVQRYPRTIPKTLSDFVYERCLDKTQQFSAGILLEAIMGKVSRMDIQRFTILSEKILIQDKKEESIVDCRFRVQLLYFVIMYSSKSIVRWKKIVDKENWWIRSRFLYLLCRSEYNDSFKKDLALKYIQIQECDTSLSGAYCYLLSQVPEKISSIVMLAPYVQHLFKQAGIIQRNRYSNSQISRYLKELIGVNIKLHWKKALGKEHDQVERTIFTALGYWKTDLTAFVNIWDTLDDRILSIVTKMHPELGGYELGKIGCLKTSIKLKGIMPVFYGMCMEIHDLRISSYLSHSVIRSTNQYTGPISQKKRKEIQRMIKEGMIELANYWL